MTRLHFPIAALTAAAFLTASPLAAQSVPMNDAERTAFGAEVRAYLMANPEVIFEAVAEFERRTAAAQNDMDGTLVEINAEEIFADDHSWVGGNVNGDLTVVEFLDYRCGFCRRAQEQIADLLGTDGNIRLIIKEFPILGPQSTIMSRFAIAVQQESTPEHYEEAHDRLMLWDGDFTQTSARLLADELGLDADSVLAQMDSPAVDAILQSNHELAQRLQISGTPTFVMGDVEGGELVRGYRQADELREIVSRLRG